MEQVLLSMRKKWHPRESMKLGNIKNAVASLFVRVVDFETIMVLIISLLCLGSPKMLKSLELENGH